MTTDSGEHKTAYRDLCQAEPSIPVFSQAWWLDATAGPHDWDVVLNREGDKINAALPFFVRQRFGQKILTTPSLTPSLGPWLCPYTGKASKRIAREKTLLTALFAALPEHGLYQQNWAVGHNNWQPLYWMGFDQTTGYTHRLHDITDIDAIWTSLDQRTRNDIRKARDRNGVAVRPATSTAEFLQVNNKTYERQNMSPPYGQAFVEKVVEAAKARGAVELLVAQGEDGNLHAGAMILYDNDAAYYLMGGGDMEFRNSGAASLLLWEAIVASRERVMAFDFEGSMIESIERFFRGFGGDLTPYLHVRKANTLAARALLLAQDFKKRRVQMKGKNG